MSLYNVGGLYDSEKAFFNSVYSSDDNLNGIYNINNKPFRFITEKQYIQNTIGLNRLQRIFLKVSIQTHISITENNNENYYMKNIEFKIKPINKIKYENKIYIIDKEEFINDIKYQLENIPILFGLEYAVKFNNNDFLIQIKNNEELNENYNNYINKETKVNISYI